nr:hypothetical protein [uncultured Agathobaculum sp.]
MIAQDMLPAMRLIGWCKNIDQSCTNRFPAFFRLSLMRSLVRNGFVRPYSATYGWRLTADGYRWLEMHDCPMQPDQHTQRSKRRFDNAAVAVTMFAAGISPFMSSIEEFSQQDEYLPAFALRAEAGQNVLGSNLVTGFIRLGDALLAVHYPHAERRVLLQREHDCVQGIALRCRCTDTGYLFCGESYTSAYRALLHEQIKRVGRKSGTYGQLADEASHACLLSCDLQGAFQMRLMRIPGYRLLLSMMLGEHAGKMVEMGLPDCDFMDSHLYQPAIISLDMDLCRIRRAAIQARDAGYNNLLLVVLDFQKTFLEQIFPPPFFRIVIIPDEPIRKLEEGASHASV